LAVPYSSIYTYLVQSACNTLFFRLSFFLNLCGISRNLHSFPTRRSSDLGVRRHLDVRHVEHGSQQGGAGPHQPAAFRGSRGRGRDRKSTRLNSSHRTISYAVFCLKKKNKNSDEKH